MERMNERVEDYRQLLERRRSGAKEDSKRGSDVRRLPARLATHTGFRTGAAAGS
jgi:hypothetical protein